jgi:hypothetical protein
MKAKIIIINWMFSFIPLCYCGDNPVIGLSIAGYFGISSWMMYKHKKEVDKVIKRFEIFTDRLLNN